MKEYDERWTVAEMWREGYKTAARWKLCPYSIHNPWLHLGYFKWPKGCLANLRLM